MLQVCPNVETLEIGAAARLYMLGTLPRSVHTVILRHPGVALSAEEMHWWALETALERGMFHPDAERRIILRSGTPEPLTYTEIKRVCKQHRVDFTFERDESYYEF